MKTRKTRYGDLIEVSTPRGLAYLQYVSRHPSYGDCIRVLPGLFSTRPTNLEELVGREGFFTYYPVTVAVRRGMVNVVTNMPIPAGYEEPRKLRRAGARSNDGRVLTWVITGETGDHVRQELNSEEKRLPIAQIWNHEMLVQQLAAEWHPEREG